MKTFKEHCSELHEALSSDELSKLKSHYTKDVSKTLSTDISDYEHAVSSKDSSEVSRLSAKLRRYGKEDGVLKEGTAEDFEKSNAGREGKTAVTVAGKEISGTIYLGDGLCIQKAGTYTFKLMSINDSGKTETQVISAKALDNLKKAHL